MSKLYQYASDAEASRPGCDGREDRWQPGEIARVCDGIVDAHESCQTLEDEIDEVYRVPQPSTTHALQAARTLRQEGLDRAITLPSRSFDEVVMKAQVLLVLGDATDHEDLSLLPMAFHVARELCDVAASVGTVVGLRERRVHGQPESRLNRIFARLFSSPLR